MHIVSHVAPRLVWRVLPLRPWRLPRALEAFNGVSSQSERTDFSGEIKFDNFDTSAGEYKPATKDHPRRKCAEAEEAG